MRIPLEKRYEYWNHFIARWAVERTGGGHGITGPRLRKIQSEIMADNDFWQDVVLRHNGLRITPEVMQLADEAGYNHCLGNFWGMVCQNLQEANLV